MASEFRIVLVNGKPAVEEVFENGGFISHGTFETWEGAERYRAHLAARA